MDTTQAFKSGRRTQARVIRGTALAAALFAALLTAQAGVAQEAALPSKMAAAPLPAARGAVPMLVSMAAMPAGATAEAAPLRGPNCTSAMHEESNVVVPVGKSTLVPLAEPTRNRTLGNPAVVQATLVSPRTLYVVGMSVGTTNMIVQGKSGACQMINVVVNIDPSGLQQSLAQLMPEEPNIRVATAAGNLVLAGRVSSAAAAQQAMHIAQAFAGAQPTQQSQSATSNSGNGAFTASQQMSSTSKPSEVINMMTIDSPQQVMLEVKVAEVSKTLMNQMGSALNIQGGFGSWTGAVVSDLLAGVSSAFVANKANNRPFRVAIDAQNTDQPVKILAEPNLVTISGQEATFLAGGKIFIPVPQSSSTGATTITLQAEEFGVALKFTPTVLSSGRINLKVAPEVSELSSTGVTLSATNVSSVSILPLITTRRASTTVQMGDGETFAIGGLIKDNVSGTLKALPGVGEVPVLGALFRSTAFQQDRTELVFIITPHLVKPLQTSNVPLPTDSFNKPNEADVFATGVMEGRGGARKLHGMPASPNAQTQTPQPQTPQTPPQQPQPGNAGDTTPGPVSRNDTATGAQASTQTSLPQAAHEPSPPAAAPSDASTEVQVSRIENEAARIATRDAATPGQPADH